MEEDEAELEPQADNEERVEPALSVGAADATLTVDVAVAAAADDDDDDDAAGKNSSVC